MEKWGGGKGDKETKEKMNGWFQTNLLLPLGPIESGNIQEYNVEGS